MFEQNELSECFFEEPQSYNIDIDPNDNYLESYSPINSMTNDQFLDYFMKIDYKTDFFQKDDALKSKDLKESSTSTNTSVHEQQHLHKKKTRRESDSNSPKSAGTGVIVDELTNQVYYEKDDAVLYRKIKKKIQNRESALRSREMKKQTSQIMEDKIVQLQNENSKLHKDNGLLKKEKNFLIEQIKYMQNLLKASKTNIAEENGNSTEIGNTNIHYNTPMIPNGIEKDYELPKSIGSTSSEAYYYNGLKQRKGRLFNILVICFLGIVYMGMEYSSSNTQKITFEGPNMSLNSVKETTSIGFCGILSKLLLILIGVLIVPMLNKTKAVREYFDRGIRKKLI